MFKNQKKSGLGTLAKAVGVSVIGLSLALTSVSDANAVNIQKLHPGTGHVDGYALRSSETLPKYFFAFGMNTNYGHHPLEQTPVNSTSRLAGIVDQLVTTDFLVSVGLDDWLTLSVDLPVATYYNIAPTFIPARDKGSMKLGDLYLETKFRIVKNQGNKAGFGLALIPFMTLPTGNDSRYLGDSSATGGALIATDWKFLDNRIFLNLGTRFKADEQVSAVNVGHEVLYGLGYQRPLIKSWDFDFIAEVFGSTRIKNFGSQDITTPVEALLTLQKRWLKNKNLITHIGGGTALTNGYGLPLYRANFGISYGFLMKKPSAHKPKEVLDLKGQIHFDSGKAAIKPDSFYVLDDVADQMQKTKEIQKLLIEGHTDSKGSSEYNLRLSNQRATALKKYLVHKGVSSDRVETKGFGESQPIESNKTAKGRAINRRSVFKILKWNWD